MFKLIVFVGHEVNKSNFTLCTCVWRFFFKENEAVSTIRLTSDGLKPEALYSDSTCCTP